MSWTNTQASLKDGPGYPPVQTSQNFYSQNTVLSLLRQHFSLEDKGLGILPFSWNVLYKMKFCKKKKKKRIWYAAGALFNLKNV